MLKVGSPESHLVKFTGIKKKILLFCAKAPLELVLGYRARMRRASVTGPQLHDDDRVTAGCFPETHDVTSKHPPKESGGKSFFYFGGRVSAA